MARSPLRVIVVSGLVIVFTNGPLFFMARRVFEQPGIWEERTIQPLFIAAALVSVAIVALDPYRISGLRLRVPDRTAAVAIGAFALVAVLSTLWSANSDLTAWRALVYVGLAFLAWVIADLGPRVRPVLAIVATFAVGTTFLAVVASPTIALDVNDDWRGIYTGRNSLAPLAAIGVIVGIAYVVDRRGSTTIAGGVLVISSLIVLLGSGSRTAWLALAVALALASLPPVFTRVAAVRGRAAATGVVGGLVAGCIVGFTAILATMWSEPTFAQRRTIWDLVWDRIAERPLHGYGFFVFWEVPEFIAPHELLQRGSAHDSLLEVWLGLGLLGVFPFVVIVVLAAWRSHRALWRQLTVDSWLWSALVTFLLLENITESFVLWFSYNWVIVMAAALRVDGLPGEPSGSTPPRSRSQQLRPGP